MKKEGKVCLCALAEESGAATIKNFVGMARNLAKGVNYGSVVTIC
jgi:hypothetical protein